MTLPEPVHAASLIVLQRAPDGPRVLMARRSAGHRFMPSVVVFPGGAVDEADFAPGCGWHLRDDVAARLQRSASVALSRALAIAACRELTEEVGLSMGTPPRLDRLDYLCRAVTPAGRPIRFDARFFVAPAEAVTGALTASRELEAPAWYGIDAALDAGCAVPTMAVLRLLRRWCDSPGDPRASVPVLIERAWGSE